MRERAPAPQGLHHRRSRALRTHRLPAGITSVAFGGLAAACLPFARLAEQAGERGARGLRVTGAAPFAVGYVRECAADAIAILAARLRAVFEMAAGEGEDVGQGHEVFAVPFWVAPVMHDRGRLDHYRAEQVRPA